MTVPNVEQVKGLPISTLASLPSLSSPSSQGLRRPEPTTFLLQPKPSRPQLSHLTVRLKTEFGDKRIRCWKASVTLQIPNSLGRLKKKKPEVTGGSASKKWQKRGQQGWDKVEDNKSTRGEIRGKEPRSGGPKEVQESQQEADRLVKNEGRGGSKSLVIKDIWGKIFL